MSDSWRKLLASTVICYVVAFLILLLSSTLSFSLETVLAEFQLRWIFSRTWAEFLAFMPVAQAWAVFITFSLAIPLTSRGLTGTSFERFGASLILLIVLTLGFSLAYGIAHPRVVSATTNAEVSSAIARSLMDSTNRSEENQDFRRALSDLEQYIAIVGHDDELAERRSRLRLAVEQDNVKRHEDAPAVAPVSREPGGADALVDRAAAALAAEDYSTAHYLGTLARSIDPENEQAARITAESLQNLRDNLPDEEDEARARLFRRIQAAKESYERGEVVDAYYAFQALRREEPANTDVARYFAEVSERVRDLAIFRDQVQSVVTMPGTGPFTFVNPTGSAEFEIVSIGKLVRLPTGIYAHRVEVMRLSPEGDLLYHVSSDYGKVGAQAESPESDPWISMVLTVQDRDSPLEKEYPQVHYGGGAVTPESESLLRLNLSADQLWLLGLTSADPAGASIPDLREMARTVGLYRIAVEPVQAELLYRLSLPFTFLIFSVFSLGFAWRYRSRYLARPPIPTFIVIPLMPLLLLPAYLLFRHAQRGLFSALLLWTGLTPAIIVLVAVEGVLVIVALTYLALSSRE